MRCEAPTKATTATLPGVARENAAPAAAPVVRALQQACGIALRPLEEIAQILADRWRGMVIALLAGEAVAFAEADLYRPSRPSHARSRRGRSGDEEQRLPRPCGEALPAHARLDPVRRKV